MKNHYKHLVTVLSLAMILIGCSPPPETPPPLTQWKIIDLTHPISTKIPLWPGDPKIEIKPWANYQDDEYFINQISIGEHSGTHWGTPNTFIKGARSAEQFKAQELVVPTIIIDIRHSAKIDSDYRLTLDDIKKWEQQHGPIPSNNMIVLYTGWQEKWNDPNAYLGKDVTGTLHWPGFSPEAANYLLTERKAVGLGTDTHGIDPGNDDKYAAGIITSKADGIILECLTGLNQLPSTGATLVIAGWSIKGGSGSPARVLAFIPPTHTLKT